MHEDVRKTTKYRLPNPDKHVSHGWRAIHTVQHIIQRIQVRRKITAVTQTKIRRDHGAILQIRIQDLNIATAAVRNICLYFD